MEKFLLVIFKPFILFYKLAIIWLMIILVQKITTRLILERIGYTYILFTALLGTPLHELSHAFFAYLCGHKIIEINLFSPNSKDGSLGYVLHEYNPNELKEEMGNFFICIAPLIVGNFIIYFLLKKFIFSKEIFLILETYLQNENIWEFLISLFNYFKTLTSFQYFIIFFIFCISIHMSPSLYDLKKSINPGIMILVIVTMFNLFFVYLFDANIDLVWGTDNPLVKFLENISLLVLVINLINFIINYFLSLIIIFFKFIYKILLR